MDMKPDRLDLPELYLNSSIKRALDSAMEKHQNQLNRLNNQSKTKQTRTKPIIEANDRMSGA